MNILVGKFENKEVRKFLALRLLQDRPAQAESEVGFVSEKVKLSITSLLQRKISQLPRAYFWHSQFECVCLKQINLFGDRTKIINFVIDQLQ